MVVTPIAGFPRLAILRRKQILSWIAAQPKSRFDAISPFIDISSVEQAEQNLQRLIDSEKRRQSDAALRIAENQGAVENYWTQSGKPGKSAIEWARDELQKDSKAAEAELQALQSTSKLLDQVHLESTKWHERRSKVAPAQTALAQADKRVADEQGKTAANASTLIRVLEAAQAFFHQHGASEHCPLCESKEFAAGLPQAVGQRLAGIQALQGALHDQERIRRQLEAVKRESETQEREFISSSLGAAKALTDQGFPPTPALPKVLFDAAGALLAEKAPTTPLAETLVKEAGPFLPRVATEIRARTEKKGYG